MRRSLLATLRAAFAKKPAPAPRQTAADYIAMGRALAAQDAAALQARREQDAQRRRVAIAMNTIVADAPARETPLDMPAISPRRVNRMTPFQAFAAIAPSAAHRVERTVSVVVADIAPSAAHRVERTVSVVVADIADVVRDVVRGGSRVALLIGLATLGASAVEAQDVRVKDLTIAEGAAPIRLMGYGLAVGLDGTGDRTASGGKGGGMTVQSVVNLLRNFNVEVPAEMMRTRNVAVVLVTAEVSPYLRSGGRFDIHVSSVGDAKSLRGGVLWATPLVAEAGGKPFALAQGALMVSESADPRDRYAAPTVETTVRLPQGGQLEVDLPRPTFAGASRLLLKEPDVGTASKIVAAINGALGAKTATVEDPGSIALALPDSGDRAVMLAKVRELSVRPDRVARLVIDGRDGTVVAGGDMAVGEAVVSHGAITLSIGAQDAAAAGAQPNTAEAPGNVKIAPGTTVQKIAAALHAVQTPAPEIGAIFLALREVGALSAEVIVR